MASGLDRNDEAEFSRCRSDVGYFIHNYLIIDDAQGDGGDGSGEMPFHLWPAQRESLDSLIAERFVVFLKARQLGITWLCLGYALWLMLFHRGKPVLLYSQGGKEAKKMLRRVKSLYERLPGWMKARLPGVVVDNTSELRWANGSGCESLPATKKAGRGDTVALAIFDEAAHQPYANFLFNALKPTVDKGGKLFVISSANGSDGFFDVLWAKAKDGLSSFKAIFLPWWSHPDRDQAWYEAKLADSTDPALIPQEYPGTPEEAFVHSGRKRFAHEWIEAQRAHLRAAVPSGISSLDAIPGFRCHVAPVPGRRYGVTADPAEGIEKDSSVGLVVDLHSGEEVASVRGQFEPGVFAEILFAMACRYDAPIAVERNNHGHAVLLRLRQLIDSGNPPEHVMLYRGADKRPGWVSSNVAKPVAVDALAASLRDGEIIVHSEDALGQLGAYIVDDKGGTTAPPGSHDDHVSCWYIFCAARASLLKLGGRLAY
jgi:hypothetical protein